MVASFTNTESLASQDALVVGGPVVSRRITLTAGNLTRGSVLGATEEGSHTDPSGNFKLSTKAANDGSQNPICILADDCDASGGAKETVAYFGGIFNENQLVIGTGYTAPDLRALFRANNAAIQLQTSIT